MDTNIFTMCDQHHSTPLQNFDQMQNSKICTIALHLIHLAIPFLFTSPPCPPLTSMSPLTPPDQATPCPASTLTSPVQHGHGQRSHPQCPSPHHTRASHPPLIFALAREEGQRRKREKTERRRKVEVVEKRERREEEGRGWWRRRRGPFVDG